MAYYTNDNVCTNSFTPREYLVDLLDSAKKHNTIIFANTSTSKGFLSLKIVQEFSREIRDGTHKALFIMERENIPVLKLQLSLLTDLEVWGEPEDFDENTYPDLTQYAVLIMTTETSERYLTEGLIDFSFLKLMVVDDGLYGPKRNLLQEILNYKKYQSNNTRILGLVSGLLTDDVQPGNLEAQMYRLEHLLGATFDTSSELVTLLRLNFKPSEYIVEYAQLIPTPYYERCKFVINDLRDFLQNHVFDPSTTYSGDLLEELEQLPSPTKLPLEILKDFEEVLEQLGPWPAWKATTSFLNYLEKLKIAESYDRHFMLLCAVSTGIMRIGIMGYYEFEEPEMEPSVCLKEHTSPKVKKLLEILKAFKPDGPRPENRNPGVPPTANVELVTTIMDVVPSTSTSACTDLKPSTSTDNVQPTSKHGKRKGNKGPRRPHYQKVQQDDVLCSVVYVENRYVAKFLREVVRSSAHIDEDLWWVGCLYCVEKVADPVQDPRTAEIEHRRQEEVLRKFRAHECNVLITTSVLEQGCDLPKCNLVIRFDLPQSFHSYVQSKSKARTPDAHYVVMTSEHDVAEYVDKLAEYMEIEKILLKRCNTLEPAEEDKKSADLISRSYSSYKTIPDGYPLTLETAIAVVNKYCAKLPSDTFTKLTPIWETKVISENKKGTNKFVCSLRLPINSPVKVEVVSKPFTSELLAKRAAAFSICTMLHSAGELDDNWQPISKENFKASEEEWNNFSLEPEDEELTKENSEQRPGTTKRRQYYYKRVADVLLHCQPDSETPTYFYRIVLKLTCPLPEEQNTRGRKIYPPEESVQGFGILTSKKIPQICSFPIFTRSGEVNVSLELCSTDVVLTPEKIEIISEFLNYSFTSVLRLQKFLMRFGVDKSESSYFIVPTITEGDDTCIDWNFLDLIYKNSNVRPEHIPNEERTNYLFDASKYKDAVIMPWYRNQDQPQYFYVAEICSHLNPKSTFPGSEYKTFEEYYFRKYSIQIQNSEQYLLDVDHTSARLNFLTPRYVNRKGVALPTSSEETKKAKRENLEQKQILVPELCTIHPFPASLWRKAVCLPCILYRTNALLLADQIRRTVAEEMGLGQVELSSDFKWCELNFGWNLSDVLKKKEAKKLEQAEEKLKQLEIADEVKEKQDEKEEFLEEPHGKEEQIEEDKNGDVENNENLSKEEINKGSEDDKDWIEIGTWSNDMLDNNLCGESAGIRYGSPTNWLSTAYDDYSSDCDDSLMLSDSTSNEDGMVIEFGADNIAEAMDYDNPCIEEGAQLLCSIATWNSDEVDEEASLKEYYDLSVQLNKEKIYDKGMVISHDSLFQKVNTRDVGIDAVEPLGLTNPPVRIYCPNYQEALFKDKVKIEDGSLAFSFDEQPNLQEHPGPSPSVILQALTMSNANDGINLERLETIGDSFLKYAITDFLYSKYENVHEGKLSHLRSKQVSNLNLYRLGKRKGFGESMIATKFDPHDNWLPPCYYVPKQLEEALIDARVPTNYWEYSIVNEDDTSDLSIDEMCNRVREYGRTLVEFPSSIPYNLVTQHSIPDKSIADCVEALIGAYLIECGPRGGLLFMAWLGINVLPQLDNGTYGELPIPRCPLVRNIPNPEAELELLLDGYDNFEKILNYKFRDKSYLLQALTHASYSRNRVTDCYQRLEFLGDAVLDYLITRHLYEDKRMHSPGALTDLRSALVNNTIFASLAVRFGFHKYFRHSSPGLHEVVERFIRLQEQCGHTLVDELYLVAGNACEEVEDVEVPKALGDIFESVAGAIYLDSGRSLDAVWMVYYRMMQKEIEQFSDRVPKSPIRELLELEPETAKFGTPEKLADGRRVRVTVEVFGKGTFKGIGRNYRIAKCTAAKCALKYLKRQGLIRKTVN